MPTPACGLVPIIIRILFAIMIKSKKNKKVVKSQQRRWPRLNPEEVPFLKSVQFNQGKETQAQIINISQGGILLETGARLRPNLKILLKLVTTKGVFQMNGYVLRSSISSLQGVPRYRSAIAFEKPFEMLEEVQKSLTKKDQETAPEIVESGTFVKSGDAQPDQATSENADEKSPAILTIIASDEHGNCLNERFELNDW
jgi:hypothetical protein